MHLAPGKILLALKPLYGVPESGLHWFITYRDHHVKKLGMKQCIVDPCILFKQASSRNSLPNVTVLQVDDSFGTGDAEFLAKEELESKSFRT